ncbi:hypothetical protein [uncultured Rubinisphaera sp.]|uniref:hypothetical protein n=1 Tax=uncultured Rubinisphaera sp. TaxID=1678686 RepID=UPI000EC745E5|nr:hypothetical protein [Planctomycetaceae bacterium]|tara:strand:+ start:2427 stop:2783 length:357 start_codon:yes stop_codon:yes gene_type:complete
MQVARKQFEEIVEQSFPLKRRRRMIREAHRELLVGLALRIGLERLQQEEMSFDAAVLKESVKGQADQYGITRAIGEVLLQIILSKIVAIVMEWLLDQMKRNSLQETAQNEMWELPELK